MAFIYLLPTPPGGKVQIQSSYFHCPRRPIWMARKVYQPSRQFIERDVVKVPNQQASSLGFTVTSEKATTHSLIAWLKFARQSTHDDLIRLVL